MTIPDHVVKAAHAGDPSAQYQLATYYGLAGLTGKSQRWLEKACAQNHPDSLLLMGRLCASELGVKDNYQQALSWFDLAIRAGNYTAMLDKAGLLAKQACLTGDWQEVVQTLVLAGNNGVTTAWTLLALMSDAVNQNELLVKAAHAGDLLAVRLLLANTLAEGKLADSRYWLGRANNSFPRSQTQALQQLLDVQHNDAAASKQPHFEATELSASPVALSLATLQHREPVIHSSQIRTWPKAMSAACCEYLIYRSEPLQRESLILDPHTGHSRRDPVRTNQSASLGPDLHDPAILFWRWQLAALAGLDERHGEWISVLRYRPGDEYKLHYDFLTPAHPDFSRGGHRRDTVLVYLNDDFSGGETEFPRAAVKITPKQGSILHFCSMQGDGSLDKSALHAGLPVEKGEKWVATLWLRQRAFY